MILRLEFLSLFHLNFELRTLLKKIKVVTSLFKPYKLFVVIPTQEMHSEKIYVRQQNKRNKTHIENWETLHVNALLQFNEIFDDYKNRVIKEEACWEKIRFIAKNILIIEITLTFFQTLFVGLAAHIITKYHSLIPIYHINKLLIKRIYSIQTKCCWWSFNIIWFYVKYFPLI